MLQKLTIKNYALIDDLSIDFDRGLNIITGETGAGKSILLGALSLILGNRADKTVLHNKERKCIVEGEFDIAPLRLQSHFRQLDLDYEDLTVIRREIAPSGKSRAFVNDSPVVLADLKSLVGQLIDVHSQFDTLELSQSRFHIKCMDEYADNFELRKAVEVSFKAYQKLSEALDHFVAEEQKAREELEYIQFQLNELVEANFSKEEQEEVEEELELLSNAKEVQEILSHMDQGLNHPDQSLVSELAEIKKLAGKAAQYLKDFASIEERLNSIVIELEDIGRDTEITAGNVQSDPARMQELQDRLSLMMSLQHKHRVQNLEELLKVQEGLEKQISGFQEMGAEIVNLRKEKERSHARLCEMAEALSETREKWIEPFENEIKYLIGLLGMKQGDFKIEMDQAPEMREDGIDDITFFFTANKGEELQPIGKVASGGELSRLMLSIKAALSAKAALPTAVFDEIDSGISGEIADKMGDIIVHLSVNTQVVAITHQPQIAAKADNHFKVYKIEEGGRTVTHLAKLSKQERVQEVAKMLSGKEITKEAVNNAKVLLKREV